MSRFMPWFVAVLAVVMAFAAVFGLWIYVVEIVIGRAGDPDQSMLYWGLPFLLGGVFAGSLAVALAWVAWRLFRGG